MTIYSTFTTGGPERTIAYDELRTICSVMESIEGLGEFTDVDEIHFHFDIDGSVMTFENQRPFVLRSHQRRLLVRVRISEAIASIPVPQVARSELKSILLEALDRISRRGYKTVDGDPIIQMMENLKSL